MLTLGDLLAQPDLGLELVAGGEASRERAIAGAHSIEIEDSAHWLEPDWVLLTTGLRLQDRAEDQRKLVAGAAKAKLTAIGFVLRYFERVPDDILAEADSRGVAVFAIPKRVPLRVITTFVASSLHDSDVLVLRRAQSIRAYLVDALSQRNPAQGIVERLAAVLESEVWLLGLDGEPRDSSGGECPLELWETIDQSSETVQELEFDGTITVVAPISSGLRHHGWLLLRLGRTKLPMRAIRPIVSEAQNLVGATFSVRQGAMERERRAREGLLAAVLAPSAATDPPNETRMADFGFDFQAPVHAGLLREGGSGRGLDEIRLELETIFANAGLPYLVGVDGDILTIVAQGDNGVLSELVAPLIESGVMIGLGRGVGKVEAIGESAQDAGFSLSRATGRSGEQGHLCRYEDLGVAERLIQREPELATIAVERHPGYRQIKESGKLLETLQAYLRTNLDVSETAAALNLHPNSVRYRLQRIEETLGESLDDLPTLVDMYLAVIADRPATERLSLGTGHAER